MCVDQGMGLAPWGALGQGKYKSRAELESRSEEVRYGGQTEAEAKVSTALNEVAEDVGGDTTLQAVALAWTSEC